MQTQEEKQELIARADESMKQAAEASSRVEKASRKSADALGRVRDKISVFIEETGRDHLTVGDVVEYLESQGRELELAEFLDLALAGVDTGQEADAVNKEAAIVHARADTFLADLINHEILDRNDERVAAVLKNLRENDEFMRENEKRAVRPTPGSEQPLRDLRQKLKERGM